jgi:hypothetical protein
VAEQQGQVENLLKGLESRNIDPLQARAQAKLILKATPKAEIDNMPEGQLKNELQNRAEVIRLKAAHPNATVDQLTDAMRTSYATRQTPSPRNRPSQPPQTPTSEPPP